MNSVLTANENETTVQPMTRLTEDERNKKTMTATAIAEREAAPLVTAEQLDLVKKTVAKDATPAELQLYLYDCARQGVHPLDRLLHFTKRGGKYTPVTSIDFMRIRAAETGEMAGSDLPRFQGEEADLVARVTVYRLTQGQRFAYEAEARWTEYKPEQNDFMWRRMPHTMLAKCAEACALRKGFPRQLAGLYASEEMDQADAKSAVLVEAPGAPVATLQPTATPPLIQGGEKPESRPSGAEASGDAARSPDTLPEMVNQETGEVLLLPDGVVLITRVLAGKGAIKLSINHSGQLPGDNAIAIFKEQLAAVATEVAQTHVPVRLEVAKSAKGNDYVKDIHPAPLPASWESHTAEPTDADLDGHGEPVDLKDLPF